MYVLAYALHGVVMEDMNSMESDTLLFKEGDSVLLYQLPYTSIMAIQAIKPRKIDDDRTYLSLAAYDLDAGEILNEQSNLIDDFGIEIIKPLRRKEISEFVNDDYTMDLIRQQHDKVIDTYHSSGFK